MESGHFCDKNIFPSHIFHKFNAIDQMIVELKTIPPNKKKKILLYIASMYKNWIESNFSNIDQSRILAGKVLETS